MVNLKSCSITADLQTREIHKILESASMSIRLMQIVELADFINNS